MTCPPHTFLWHLTLGGRKNHLAPDWPVGLLVAAWTAAERQRAQGPLAWELWLPIDDGFAAHYLQGGLS